MSRIKFSHTLLIEKGKVKSETLYIHKKGEIIIQLDHGEIKRMLRTIEK